MSLPPNKPGRRHHWDRTQEEFVECIPYIRQTLKDVRAERKRMGYPVEESSEEDDERFYALTAYALYASRDLIYALSKQ
jgi:hypothetical protein